MTGDSAKLGKLAIVAHGQDQMVLDTGRCVGRCLDLKHLVRHDVLVRIARTTWHFATHQVVGTQIGEHRHLGVQQGHVHPLTLSGLVRVTQSCQNTHRGVHAGEQIGHSHPYFLRAAAQIVALAGDAHQAAYALHRIVVACAVGIGACLPKTGHAAIHQLGVE